MMKVLPRLRIGAVVVAAVVGDADSRCLIRIRLLRRLGGVLRQWITQQQQAMKNTASSYFAAHRKLARSPLLIDGDCMGLLSSSLLLVDEGTESVLVRMPWSSRRRGWGDVILTLFCGRFFVFWPAAEDSMF